MRPSAEMVLDLILKAKIFPSFKFYFGPNHYPTLKSYDEGFEKIIPLGGKPYRAYQPLCHNSGIQLLSNISQATADFYSYSDHFDQDRDFSSDLKSYKSQQR